MMGGRHSPVAASTIAKRAGTDRNGGFTILEVLVALAILGTALAALFGLQQSASRAAIAVERAQQSMEADRTALAILASINPMLQPEGRAELGHNARMSWQATPIGDAKAITAATGAPGRFTLQRFDVAVTIDAPGRASWGWSVERLGWRPVRGYSPGD
ncbi:hypothetical protein JCM17843_12360 [Kordiimonadales bacterium JCM 17843]|nr:hypothetical protein JCM17843_12360 [Kordiimonadales bacterium JCM 17843]